MMKPRENLLAARRRQNPEYSPFEIYFYTTHAAIVPGKKLEA